MATAAFVLIAYRSDRCPSRDREPRVRVSPIRARRFGAIPVRPTCCAWARISRAFLRSSATAEKAGSLCFLAVRYAAGYRVDETSVAICAVAVFLATSFRCSSVLKAERAYPLRAVILLAIDPWLGLATVATVDSHRGLVSLFVACGGRSGRIAPLYYFFLFGAREMLPR